MSGHECRNDFCRYARLELEATQAELAQVSAQLDQANAIIFAASWLLQHGTSVPPGYEGTTVGPLAPNESDSK